MKIGNMMTRIVALLCTSLLGTELTIVPASAQSSSDVFVAFVNGSGDCCAGEMWDVKNRLESQGATIWTTSYASFKDGSTTNKLPGNISTDLDPKFIIEAAQVLNKLPESTPIILVGHSYGGDSILQVLPFIKRRVQLVVTIDPVGTGGFRKNVTSLRVPSNVDYFMNRWQENGLEGRNIVPFDSRANGSIPCSATVCDQDSQNLARKADGSEIRVSCGAEEITCDGWKLPGCNFGGCWKGSNGTKARRMFHNDMPVDASIQRIVGDRIQEQLANGVEAQSNGQISLNTPAGVKCLDAAGETWNTDRGTLQLYACNGSPNQQWIYNNGQISLNTPAGVKCLDAAGEAWNTDRGTPQLYACNGSPNQQWELDQ
jgi:hypothetical protein